MPKPPKRYYANDDERRQLVNEYTPHLSSFYVPTGAARGIIRALLEQVPISHLNREAAENHLMAELLHDNGEMEKAKKRAEDYSNEDQSAEDAARAAELLAGEILSGHGEDRVRKVLQEYASHSVDRMREESDEVLKAIEAHPVADFRILSQWADANLPSILRSLKDKQACFSGCAGNTTWPPRDRGTRARILPKNNETGLYGQAAVKDGILAYFHDLSTERVRDYLQGIRPKTQSRSRPTL